MEVEGKTVQNVQEGRGRVSGTGGGDCAQVQEGIGRASGSEWSGRQCVRGRVIASEFKGRQCARGRVSGSEWRERQCVTTVTTHPPSPFLYFHTLLLHSLPLTLPLPE